MLFSIHSPDTDDFLNRMQTCESLLVICHFCIKITSKKNPNNLRIFLGSWYKGYTVYHHSQSERQMDTLNPQLSFLPPCYPAQGSSPSDLVIHIQNGSSLLSQTFLQTSW